MIFGELNLEKTRQQYYSNILLIIYWEKRTVTHLPTTPENVTTLTCGIQNI